VHQPCVDSKSNYIRLQILISSGENRETDDDDDNNINDNSIPKDYHMWSTETAETILI
jgi:hypothetical protein